MGMKIEQDRKEVQAKLLKAKEEVERFSALYDEEKRAKNLIEASLRTELERANQMFEERFQTDAEQKARV